MPNSSKGQRALPAPILRSVDEVEPRTLKRELLDRHGLCSIVAYGLVLDEIKSGGELTARQIKPRLSRTVALLLNANLSVFAAQFLSIRHRWE